MVTVCLIWENMLFTENEEVEENQKKWIMSIICEDYQSPGHVQLFFIRCGKAKLINVYFYYVNVGEMNQITVFSPLRDILTYIRVIIYTQTRTLLDTMNFSDTVLHIYIHIYIHILCKILKTGEWLNIYLDSLFQLQK